MFHTFMLVKEVDMGGVCLQRHQPIQFWEVHLTNGEAYLVDWESGEAVFEMTAEHGGDVRNTLVPVPKHW